MYQWCEFKSRRGKNKNLSAQSSNSNTVWFKFSDVYIYTIFLLGFGTDSVVFLVFHFNTTTKRFKLQAHLNLISTFLLIRFKIVADVTNNDFSDGSLK